MEMDLNWHHLFIPRRLSHHTHSHPPPHTTQLFSFLNSTVGRWWRGRRSGGSAEQGAARGNAAAAEVWEEDLDEEERLKLAAARKAQAVRRTQPGGAFISDWCQGVQLGPCHKRIRSGGGSSNSSSSRSTGRLTQQGCQAMGWRDSATGLRAQQRRTKQQRTGMRWGYLGCNTRS